MKIVMLEKIEMTESQFSRLESLGNVERFETSDEKQCLARIKGADVVLVDWIDPSPFILTMKTPSLLALMSTGYGWIQHISEARQRGILISNVPGYSTESVAEHLIGLALCVARQTMVGDRNIRAGIKEKGSLEGVELKGRTIGIIGLGRIGMRVAEISKCLGMNVITYNRNPKSVHDIKDVSLEILISSSQIVCVCCSFNDESKGMLDDKILGLLSFDAIIIGSTWGVVDLPALIPLLKSHLIQGAGFDVAIEGGKLDFPDGLLNLDNLVLTPHIGFNTLEAKMRQVDICISNIEAFKSGVARNIVN